MPGDGVTLQTLTLQIESEASNASKGIDSLISTLKKLEKIKGDGLSTFTNHLTNLSNTLKGMSMNSVSVLNGLATSLSKIKAVGDVKISSSIGNQITAIKEAVRDINTTKIQAVGDAFEHFKSIGELSISPSIGTNLTKIKTALTDWKVDPSTINKVVESLMPLTKIQKNSMASFINNVSKLPEKLKELNEIDFTQASENIDKIFSTIQKYDLDSMATRVSTIADSLRKMGVVSSKLNNTSTMVGDTSGRSGGIWGWLRSFTDMYHLVHTTIRGIQGIGNFIAKTAKATSEYVEDLNLFTVSLGEYAEKAQEYGEKVAGIVGINPGQWLKYQGTFMSLATGFGIAGDKAAVMSQQLTQLAYDLASFYNLDIEDAMTKLQSGISGELEPLRRLGVDLSIARLKEDAHRLGIEEKVQTMTQAEKSLLRYNAIMEQTTLAQGDMARTLIAPSNQLRVLKAQVTQAAQAIGSIFIPMLNAILPVAIAVVKAVRLVAEAIASLFGYSLPEIDYSGISSASASVADSVDSTASGLGSAAKNAKKLKDYVLGIDELNIIRPDEGTSGGSGGGGGSSGTDSGGLFDLDLKEYDFLNGLIDTQISKISAKIEPVVNWIKDNLTSILDIVKNIAIAFLTWKVSDQILKVVDNLIGIDPTSLEGLKNLEIGLALTVAGVTMDISGASNVGFSIGSGQTIKGGDVIEGVLGMVATAIGGSQMGVGVAKILGLSTKAGGVWGLAIGTGVALLVSGLSVAIGFKEGQIKSILDEKFGSLHLTDPEVEAIVKLKFAGIDLVGVDAAMQQYNVTQEIEEAINKNISDINGLAWKVNVGIELTPEETSQYQETLNEFVANAQRYVVESDKFIELGIRASFGDSEEGDAILSVFKESGADIQAELTTLGQQLQGVLNEAFSDGALTIDEQEAIENITSQIAHITSIINQSEQMTKLQMIHMDFSPADMDQDTYNRYKERMDEYLNEVTTNYQEEKELTLNAMNARLIFAQEKFGIDSSEAQEIQAAIDEFMNNNPFDLKIKEAQFQVNSEIWDTLKGMWVTDLSTVLGSLDQVTLEELGNPTYDDPNWFVNWINGTVTPAMTGAVEASNLSQTEKDALSRQIQDSIPREQDLIEALNEAVSTGKLIPTEISEGLHDIKALQAMSGDTQALAYLIGETMTKDKSFKEMLKKAAETGQKIPPEIASGIRSHVQVIKDASTGMPRVLVDGVDIGIEEVTPEMMQLFQDMGINAVDGYETGLDSFNPDPAVKGMTDDVAEKINAKRGLLEMVADGLVQGYSTEFGTLDKDEIAKKLADVPISETKTRLGWNGTSSSNFDRIAEGSAKGYSTRVSNIDSDNIADKYTEFYGKVNEAGLPGKIKTLADEINGSFNITPSTGTTTVDSFISGMKTSISNANFGQSAYKSYKDYFTWANGKTLGETLGSGVKEGIKNKIGNTTVVVNKPNKAGNVTLSVYGNGGFVDQGELFIARESGAEMVGRIGGRTAVANNDQIVHGIESGVTTANARVVDAINTLISVVSEKNMSVNISDTSIGLANERYSSSRGEYIDSSAFANTY